MSYLKNLFLSIREILVITIIEYAILILVVVMLGFDKAVIWGSLFLLLLQIIYIGYKVKSGMRFSFKGTNYFPYILLGISMAIIYNMIIFRLGMGFVVTDDFPLVLNILCSGIVGPLFEEVLFRYVLIENLLKFNSKKWVIVIISGIIFGIFHTNLITIIYATIVGLVNSYIYVKKRDITKTAIIHMAGNIMVNFLFGYNRWILGLGIILLFISGLILMKKGEIK